MGIENYTSHVDTSFLLLFWVSIFFLVAITGSMIYFCIRYHHTRNDKPQDIHGNVMLEIIWTVIPTILVMGFFYYGYKGYEMMNTIPENSMVVKTYGAMWKWSYEYENGTKVDSTLYVPAGRPVHLELHSNDVIHSYYIPDFRIKMDVVPGVNNKMWFVAPEPGDYQVFCTEYCGDRHSYMLGMVKALSEEDFQTWYNSMGTVEPGTAKQKLAEAASSP